MVVIIIVGTAKRGSHICACFEILFFCLSVIILAGNNYPDLPICRRYEICHTNFTSTFFFGLPPLAPINGMMIGSTSDLTILCNKNLPATAFWVCLLESLVRRLFTNFYSSHSPSRPPGNLASTFDHLNFNSKLLAAINTTQKLSGIISL